MDLVDFDQLSYLPPEVFEIILPKVGGCTCLRLRRTCKRIMMMVDNMEMRLKPSIWFRYVFSDFSKPCIESLLPWVSEKDRRQQGDGYNWKIIYACLINSLKKHTVFVRKQVMLPGVLQDVSNVSFAGSQFFVHQHKKHPYCIGIAHSKNYILPLTELRSYRGTDPLCNKVQVSRMNAINFMTRYVFKPCSVVNQRTLFVDKCKAMVRLMGANFTKIAPIEDSRRVLADKEIVQVALKKLMTYSKNTIPILEKYAFMQYSNKVLVVAYKKTILFCLHSYDGAEAEFICSEAQSPYDQDIKSIHRSGNVLVVIVRGSYNNVFTNEMYVAGSGMIQVGKWKRLLLVGTVTAKNLTGETVCDADVAGCALVLITDLGKVYVTSLEDPSHEAIQRKLYLAYDIQRPCLMSTYYVCVDLSYGFVIGILEDNRKISLLFAS